MSLPKNDRNFRQKSGKTFPTVSFATVVAAALHREYDGPAGGIWKVMALTGANERSGGSAPRNGGNPPKRTGSPEHDVAIVRRPRDARDSLRRMGQTDPLTLWAIAYEHIGLESREVPRNGEAALR